jgi:hypothetical protein
MMDEKVKKEQELKFYKETEFKLKTASTSGVISTLKELHKTGNPAIMSLIFDLLDTTQDENIVKEIIILLGEIKNNKTVPTIAEYISNHTSGKHLSKVIAACWQSGLDFSSEITLFVKCFIEGNYEVALESFTVIEEMLWHTPIEKINICKATLTGRAQEVAPDKKPLYTELIKILDEGVSMNREDFPDLYLK